MPGLTTYIYSTTRDAELCKEGYAIFEKGFNKEQGNIVVKDVDSNPILLEEYANSPLPVLVRDDDTKHHGRDAVEALAKILRVKYTPSIPSIPSVPSVPSIPSIPSIPIVSSSPRSSEHSLSVPMTPPPPLSQPSSTRWIQDVKEVEPQYILYTDELAQDIMIPPNGLIVVQSMKRIQNRFGHTLPNYLLATSPQVKKSKRRPLPVLVTNESCPTVWYGIAAKEWCKVLCELNGGAVLI